MITKSTKKSCKDYEKNSQEGIKCQLWKWDFIVTKGTVAMEQENHCGTRWNHVWDTYPQTERSTMDLLSTGPQWTLSKFAVLKGKKDQQLSLSGFSCSKALARSTGHSKRQSPGASVRVHLQPRSSGDRRSRRNISLKLSWTQHMRPNCTVGAR